MPPHWSSFIDGQSLCRAGKRLGVGVLKVANLACFVHLFNNYVGRPSFMAGPSMLPTLAASGELVIEDCFTYRWNPNKLARGDMITLVSPLDSQRFICKRVIGLPGDTICVDPSGRLAPSTEHVIIPPGHIWIVGDNAAASRDSRMYGPVPIALVRSRILVRVWPIKDFTIFRNPTTHLE